ncbi:hypothetical protein Hanom_Chr07g00580731 [Helianthus anomalus]
MYRKTNGNSKTHVVSFLKIYITTSSITRHLYSCIRSKQLRCARIKKQLVAYALIRIVEDVDQFD